MSGTVWLTMAEGKRYYWLKLKDDFFDSKRIKKLRRMAGGNTYTIIYLKMQLLAMKHDGIIKYTGLESTFAEELALDLDEEPDDVAVTLAYLTSVGLAETSDNISFFFPYAVENVGSEGASAQRVREFRQRQSLQCNAGVTPVKQIGNGEIESEKEIEKEIEKESESNTTLKPIPSEIKQAAQAVDRGRPKDAQEVAEFFFAEKLNGDPSAFFDHYSGVGWRVGGSPITDWKAIARSWSRKEKVYGTDKPTKAAQSMGGRASSVPMSLASFMEATANI